MFRLGRTRDGQKHYVLVFIYGHDKLACKIRSNHTARIKELILLHQSGPRLWVARTNAKEEDRFSPLFCCLAKAAWWTTVVFGSLLYQEGRRVNILSRL